jgi:hypothetical protein
MYIMKTRVKRGGFDTDDEYNTPTATPESDAMTDNTWDSWYDERFTEDTDKETTSTPEYNDELDEGFLENNEDTETDENNQFDEFVLPQDLDELQIYGANNQAAANNQIYGAYQDGGKRRRKSNKRKSNKRRKSRRVKRRRATKRRYMRGGQPALTAGTMPIDRVTGYVEPTYRM